MLAPTLALLTRSFRLDARSRRAHLVRFVFVLFMLATVAFTHLSSSFGSAPGLMLLSSIAWSNFVLILLAGIGFLSTAISEEKDEGTLGLLKMAGASALALLLGKSTTRMVSLLLVLGVQFPFVLLATTLGGVTLHQVIAVFVALAAFLVFVANLGLLLSVVTSNARWAERMMTIALGCGVLLGPVLMRAIALAVQQTSAVQSAWVLSATQGVERWTSDVPIYHRIAAILSTGFSESILSKQVFTDLVGGGLLFCLSWLLFERCTRERHGMKPLEAIFVEPLRRKRRTTKNRAWKYAMAWKDFHFVAGGWTLAIVECVVFAIVVGVVAPLARNLMPGDEYSRETIGMSAMMIAMVVSGFLLSLFSARVFREEVQAHTLPFLMMLPQSTARIAASKAAAAIPALSPAALYFLFGAVVYPEGLLRLLWGMLSVGAFYGICFFACFLSLTAYLSLVVKWGALPLALFLSYMSQCFLTPIYMFLGTATRIQDAADRQFIAFLMQLIPAVLCVVLTILFQIGICKKLESLAAE